MSMQHAAVIIPHYNDIGRLERCLAALMQQDTTGIDVVVVDNGSTQPLDAVIRAHPDVRFLTEPEKGAACARNRGVRETTAQHLFFLDADCLPAADWLAVARRVCDSADLVGGKVEVFDETPPPRTGAQAFETVFAFDFQHYITVKGFAGSGNLLTRRDVFEAVGPFVPGRSEDIDWCHRARAMKYSLVYAQDLVVGHPSRGDWVALERKWRRVNQEVFGLSGNSARSRLTWAAKALAMPLSILAHAPKILAHPRLNGSAERMAALATLVRLRFMRMGWMLRQAAGRAV